MQHLFPDALATTLHQRLCALFPESAPNILIQEVQQTLANVRRLGPTLAIILIKTWSNSWATSSRYHEPL
eukprot:CAMPEP_0180657430 /NCGR_PEP_ID=MMETSP1037_2-20121125/56421_1 /TAXON_ID=632150 /ORGANISM="Azadinium spinosum, Strain 3D9" /LENGTH=69 /DNA_ID=CAMNT_0022684159 /DNA_START=9 /DNA_END=215 /DNA_ORIENTATION=-